MNNALPGLWDPRRESFDRIWHLAITERDPKLPSAYTTPLLVAIMWEESTFCNIREIQKGGKFGPACGFGQVNDTEYWRFKSEYGSRDQIRERVLGDSNFAVRLVSMMLADLHSRLKSRTASLKAYAGIGTPGADQHNVDGYNHWLDAERIMMDALADPNKCCTSVFGDTIPLKSYVEAALKAAKPNSAAFVEQATIGVPEKLQPDGSGPRDLLNAVGS